MAWDFSDDPELQEQLDWMAGSASEVLTGAGGAVRGHSPPLGGIPIEHVPARRAAARERLVELLEGVKR